MKKKTIHKLTASAMLLALGMLLPFLTAQNPELGNMLLPMHLPVLLCGMLCGWQYGGTVGLVLPLLRSACFTMPPLYPKAIYMSVELAVYGLIVGLVYRRFKHHNTQAMCLSLITAMAVGRVALAIAQVILLGLDKFAFSVFMSEAVLTALPGMALQLILIPSVLLLLQKVGVTRKLK